MVDTNKNDIAERLAKLKSGKSPLERAMEPKGIKIPTSDSYKKEHSEARANVPAQKVMSGGAVMSIPTSQKSDSEGAKGQGNGVAGKPRDVHEEELKVLTTRIFKEERLIDKKGAVLGNNGSGEGNVVNAKEKLADADVFKIPEKQTQKKKEEVERENEGITVSSRLHGSQLTYDKKKIEAARNTLQEKKQGWFVRFFGVGNKQKNVSQILNHNQDSQTSGVKPSPSAIHNTNSKKIAESYNVADPQKTVDSTQKDTSIFGGAPEVSRIKLEYKMRKDPNIWKAARDVKLNISPLERAKLVKEVFSQAYGRNISKTDLRWGIKKLNQKLVDAKDKPAEHEKIRKEIKFFKKIGGIKD